MSDQELQAYTERSAYPFDIVRLLHSTLIEGLRTDTVMAMLEDVALANNVDIIELAEQANETLAVPTDIMPTAHQTALDGPALPFTAN